MKGKPKTLTVQFSIYTPLMTLVSFLLYLLYHELYRDFSSSQGIGIAVIVKLQIKQLVNIKTSLIEGPLALQ